MTAIVKAPRALVEIERGECRFPVNDAPNGRHFLFCGDVAREGKPYCTNHCRLAYRPAGDEARRSVG